MSDVKLFEVKDLRFTVAELRAMTKIVRRNAKRAGLKCRKLSWRMRWLLGFKIRK